jgi:hypothetical protein
VAVRAISGEVEMAIVSRHTGETATLTVEFAGAAWGVLASCEVMAADGPARTNTPLGPRQVAFVAQPLPVQSGKHVQIAIAPRSITWLRWRR